MIILEEKELIRVSRFVGRLARNVLFEFVGLAMAERTGRLHRPARADYSLSYCVASAVGEGRALATKCKERTTNNQPGHDYYLYVRLLLPRRSPKRTDRSVFRVTFRSVIRRVHVECGFRSAKTKIVRHHDNVPPNRAESPRVYKILFPGVQGKLINERT